jgi:hypothetical protein
MPHVASARRLELRAMGTSATTPSRLLRGKAAAAYYDVPYTTFRLWAKKGLIPVVRIPGTAALLFDRAELDLLIERSKERAHERWAQRLDDLEARRVARQQPAEPAPTIPNRARGRRSGVSRTTPAASGDGRAAVPAIVPNGSGADR